MNEVKYISEDSFFKKYKSRKIDLVKEGFFSKKDIEEIQEIDNMLSMGDKVNTLVSYLKFSFRYPFFINSFLIPQVKQRLEKLLFNKSKIPWENGNLVRTNNLKARIATAFKPQTILEIGTYLGVGAATFKYNLPKSTIYTMSPKNTSGSNNPVFFEYLGFFYKKKQIKVKQIWADSTMYDYTKLPKIDFTYIDGNHEFEYVYSDLKKTSDITTRCVLVDDYIPIAQARNGDLVFGPWNEGVVRATDRFLKENRSLFKEAYWIKGSKFCILIK